MIGRCEICGGDKNVRFYQKKQVLCGKHREQMRKFGLIRERTMADKNDYIDRGDFYEIILYDRSLKEKARAMIDKDDYLRISAISWCLDSNGYVMSGKGTLHRFLLGSMPNMEIDHINRNKLDNRRNNLRFVTHQKNTQNRVTKNAYQRPSGRWSSYVGIDGKTKTLGTFNTQQEAQMIADCFKNHLASGEDAESFFVKLIK